MGLGYMSKYLNRSDSETEAGVISKNLRPTEIDWVEAGVVSPVVRHQYECGKCLELFLS